MTQRWIPDGNGGLIPDPGDGGLVGIGVFIFGILAALFLPFMAGMFGTHVLFYIALAFYPTISHIGVFLLHILIVGFYSFVGLLVFLILVQKRDCLTKIFLTILLISFVLSPIVYLPNAQLNISDRDYRANQEIQEQTDDQNEQQFANQYLQNPPIDIHIEVFRCEGFGTVKSEFCDPYTNTFVLATTVTNQGPVDVYLEKVSVDNIEVARCWPHNHDGAVTTIGSTPEIMSCWVGGLEEVWRQNNNSAACFEFEIVGTSGYYNKYLFGKTIKVCKTL